MAEVAAFMPVEQVYPGLDATVECLRGLLRCLSRTDALLWCARLNLIVASPFVTEAEGQRRAIRAFFPYEGERRAVYAWLDQRGGIERSAVFFRGQLLELARWVAAFCKDDPSDGRTFEAPRIRHIFGQAALVAAGLWGERVYDATFAQVVGRPLEEARRRSMATMRTSFIENSRGSVAPVIIGRGYRIWNDLLAKHPGLDDEFIAVTGMRILEYLRLMAFLCIQRSVVDPTAGRDNAFFGLFDGGFRSVEPVLRRSLHRLLALEAVPVRDFCAQIQKEGVYGGQHIPIIRRHPVIVTSDARAIVLDPVFLAEHACVGPLFLLAGSRNGVDANSLFGVFGDAFEQYVAGLVRDRYPDADGLARRSFANVDVISQDGEQVGQIDAAILLAHESVCVIEAKAVFIRDDTLGDNDVYLKVLGNKYGASLNQGGRRQGMAQLVRIALSIAQGRLAPDFPDEIRSARLIYPVLLVHDRNLDSPGTGEYLAREFLRELGAVDPTEGYIKVGDVRVAFPILLTVDDFEWLEASLEGFSLAEFLQEFAQSAPTRHSSIRDFAAQSRFKAKMRNPETQWGTANDLMEGLFKHSETAKA